MENFSRAVQSRLCKLLFPLAAVFWLTSCTSYHTIPILDSQGDAIPGSLASLEKIRLGNADQWILVRGNNTHNPILLKLHGGPGQAEMATAPLNKLLEKDFIVVEWDQRGAGKSADSIEPESAMNVAQFVEDTHELSQLLLKRFNQKRLVLVGHSWGSVIGLKAVQKYPEQYRAFVSTGQIANFQKGSIVGYRFLLNEAKRHNNHDALDDLLKIGPPPYVQEGGDAKREIYFKWLTSFGAVWHSSEKFDRVGWMISSVEYAWPEKLRYPRAAARSFDLLLPQLAAIDMNRDVPKVDVPVWFAVGRHDHMAPSEVSEQYFKSLAAPLKEWVRFDNSAHFPQWEEKEKFHDLLIHKVLPATQDRR